jgi:thioredoxin-like negative regulator of GroEL
MEHETWPDKQVAGLVARSFVALKVDVDKHGEIADRYQVSGIPAIVLLDADGRVVRRTEGYLPPSGMLQFLRSESQ